MIFFIDMAFIYAFEKSWKNTWGGGGGGGRYSLLMHFIQFSKPTYQMKEGIHPQDSNLIYDAELRCQHFYIQTPS